ncbi:hypothetical protein UO65_6377 [Actinokineospora spheciospongiae]|uniref:Uncharacterized protein n=1 Tax=Actinokineospora spheciospongiae TaxID=909613 RepID=W7ICH9_9PSEU|nr:hypothetical protein [Actinokineospora spheciospongiae]EWC58485.1 hypothetical protein UO65_6377 [Actinokineospora spheciospongiae]
MTGHDIYVAMTTGPGTETLQNGYRIADAEAKREAERADLIKRLAEKMQAGWEGEAGSAAYGGAKPIADATLLGMENLERTHVLLRMQAETFGDLSSKLEPMDASPPDTGIWDDMTPWDTDTEDQLNEYNQKSQKNIDVYRAYDANSQANAQDLPTDYSTLTDPGGEITVNKPDEPGGPPPVSPPRTVSPPQVNGSGDTTTAQQWQQQPGQPTPTYPLDPPPPGPGNQGQNGNEHQNGNIGTKPAQYVPTPPRQYPPGVPRPGEHGVQRPINWPGGDPSGGFGGQGGVGGQGYGGGAGSRGGAGGFGARGGFGGGAGGMGAGGAGAAEHGPGARAGAGAGAGAGEHGPGSRGFGAAADERAGGRGGQPAGGGAGGGRGQGGEDEEHERASFLIEDDPEAVFGTDEVTAPPVIGG